MKQRIVRSKIRKNSLHKLQKPSLMYVQFTVARSSQLVSTYKKFTRPERADDHVHMYILKLIYVLSD